MNTIHLPSILQNFGKFGNFQNNRRVNSEICVFVSTYPYNIYVLFHTFFFTFGNYKELSINGAKLFQEYIKT